MKHRTLAGLAFTLVLTACGGGGGSGTAASPNALPTAQPPAVTPDCRPAAPALVNLYGDSTQWGTVVRADGTVEQSEDGPAKTLQRLFDARFGPGRVKVSNQGVSGGSTATFLAAGGRIEGISVLNYGINDSQALPLAQYRSNLERLGPTFFETPNPPDRNRWPAPYDFEAFAQAMRDVAAAKGTPLIDTFAYVHSVERWSDLYSDGAHPGDEMYRLIATHALYPALLPWVASSLCEKQP